MAVVQRIRCLSSGHRVVQAEGSSPGADTYQRFFLINDFYFSFVRDGPLFFIGEGGGVYLLHKKKLFASCSWLKKNCLLQGYELKNCLQTKGKLFGIH